MKRGQIWTASGGSACAGKPRPVVIVQDDHFSATASITVCGMTTVEIDAPLFRIPVLPDARNGLSATLFIMVDKLTTIQKAKLGARIGELDVTTMRTLNRAMVLFLGIAERVR